MASGLGQRAPFPNDPDEFNDDERISYSKTSGTYLLEDETGQEWEWLAKPSKWVPVTDEALLEQQQQAYKVEGVDEDAPAIDPKKRKATEGDGDKTSKKQKAEPGQQKNKAIFVTSLPDDTDVEEIQSVFSKCGVIAEGLDKSEPRIKLYHDDDGKFKGEALIVYFRPESVDLAVTMLDESDFRFGTALPTGPMRVMPADASFKSQKDQPLATDQAKKKGTNANRDRQKVIKKNQEMNSRLADWDDDDPQTLPDTSSRWDKVVILKNLFSPSELLSDPQAASDIKEDMREEGEKYGDVSNVTLYDKEDDGVVTMRFGNSTAAQAYMRAVDGRAYDKRYIDASIADGSEKFKKSRKVDVEDDEEARLERFTKDAEGEKV